MKSEKRRKKIERKPTRCAWRSAGCPSMPIKLPLTRASSMRSSFRWYSKRSVSRRDHACVTDSRSNWFRISTNRSYESWNRSSICPWLCNSQSRIHSSFQKNHNAHRSRTISVHFQHRSSSPLRDSWPWRGLPSEPTNWPSFNVP